MAHVLHIPRAPIQKAFFLALVLGVSLGFVWLVWDLISAVFWAVVLAILFGPLYRRFRDELRGRDSIASGVTIVAILVLVILPLTGVAIAVGNEAAKVYERIESGEVNVQAPVDAVERAVPQVSRFLARFGIDIDRLRQGLSGAAVSVSRFLASQALAIGQNTLRLLLLILVVLYLLFFFLRDGKRLTDAIVRALPLGDRRERILMERFAAVTRATIKGTIIVGVIQGSLAGITFALLGIPAAVFWGVIMTILSLLPAVGSVIVWGPAAIILLLSGEILKGVILLVVGALLISLIDNILRPVLVGRETRMPDWLVLISILGGLAAVGLSGFVIGPIVAGLFLTVWELFVEEYGPIDGADVGTGPTDTDPPESPPPPPDPIGGPLSGEPA